MGSGRRVILVVALAALAVFTPLLAGCGSTPAPTAAPTKAAATTAATQPATAVPATKAPPTATVVPATPTAAGPTVGGKFVWGISSEPDSLDVHKSGMTVSGNVTDLLGATLIARDPNDGKFVPYLATSWKSSDDGLSWDFTLRKDVKFHDGTPMTAADFVYTMDRVNDPATKATLGGFAEVEKTTALDEYTVRITLKHTSYPFLLSLSLFQPLPKAQAAKADTWGRSPVGVGPYKFKEWKTGGYIQLERNPDFKWGLPWMGAGPYIQTIEFRILPETATLLAGVEAGEIDYAAVPAKDIARIKAVPGIQIFQYLYPGGSPSILFNCSKAPFDDVRVRQAFNLAVDRQAAIKLVADGNGVEMHLPIPQSVSGWWADGEKLGYGFDLDRAKALMKEAGYVLDAKGKLTKDGQLLKVTILTNSVSTKMAEVLTAQYKALGVTADIFGTEWGLAIDDILNGKFDLCVFSYSCADVDFIRTLFTSEKVDGMNLARLDDPKLDELLTATQPIMDPVKRQAAVETALKYMLDKAVMGPLYAPTTFFSVSGRVKGFILSPVTKQTWLVAAYIVGK